MRDETRKELRCEHQRWCTRPVRAPECESSSSQALRVTEGLSDELVPLFYLKSRFKSKNDSLLLGALIRQISGAKGLKPIAGM